MAGDYPDRIKQLPLYDGRFDAYKMQSEQQGCEVLFASYPAGTSIPAHTHETDNYGVITRGELILKVGDQTRRYAAGDWYQIAANVEHAAEFEVETDEIEFWFEPDS